MLARGNCLLPALHLVKVNAGRKITPGNVKGWIEDMLPSLHQSTQQIIQLKSKRINRAERGGGYVHNCVRGKRVRVNRYDAVTVDLYFLHDTGVTSHTCTTITTSKDADIVEGVAGVAKAVGFNKPAILRTCPRASSDDKSIIRSVANVPKVITLNLWCVIKL